VTEQQERHLALIYTATFQLNMLVNDLTELAHHGGDERLHTQRVCFSVEDALGSVRDLVQPIAEQRQLELRIVQNASDLRFGYPEALTRVLLNLVTNALRVTASGFVAIEARDVAKASVEFAVVDSGPGLSASELNRLFQPFAVAGRERRGISSSGLGLSICRRLVGAMGGELSVSSTVGAGSRFSFALRLPRARTDCTPLGATGPRDG
jgi:signal transduction histidine kinase